MLTFLIRVLEGKKEDDGDEAIVKERDSDRLSLELIKDLNSQAQEAQNISNGI